ncbi:MAG TPA: NADP-dependent oxidoreductase [Candidatus Micrarchaeaceae archaeon]|nr:NADP-dependent oxidoreductase [Candidatus Micrarchaeaceae archaeon]
MSDPAAQLAPSSLPSTMKAIRLHGRGAAGIRYEDAPLPKLLTGDALVRVYTAAITPTELEWDETYQNADGSSRLPSVPGHEISGVVAAVAPDVTDVRAGDEVYALSDFPRDGGAAEFVAVPAANLAPKPQTIDHVHAAAITLSGLTAWQAFFTQANLQAGQKVLVHGAAGGVGVFAVQLARWRGARVTATARAKDAEFLRELGAERVIDYTSERFYEIVSEQDIVLDTIGGETQERSWKVLRPGGAMINLRGPLAEEKVEEYGVRGIFFIVTPSRADLREMARLVDRGELRSIVSQVLPLAEAKRAFEPLPPDHGPGKIVLRVREEN